MNKKNTKKIIGKIKKYHQSQYKIGFGELILYSLNLQEVAELTELFRLFPEFPTDDETHLLEYIFQLYSDLNDLSLPLSYETAAVLIEEIYFWIETISFVKDGTIFIEDISNPNNWIIGLTEKGKLLKSKMESLEEMV